TASQRVGSGEGIAKWTTSEFSRDEPVHGLTVTSTSDRATCPNGPGKPGYTLRCALERANQSNGGEVVTFHIAPTDPGCRASSFCMIHIRSPLPKISQPSTLIDGFSEPGSRANILPIRQGDDARVAIDL